MILRITRRSGRTHRSLLSHGAHGAGNALGTLRPCDSLWPGFSTFTRTSGRSRFSSCTLGAWFPSFSWNSRISLWSLGAWFSFCSLGPRLSFRSLRPRHSGICPGYRLFGSLGCVSTIVLIVVHIAVLITASIRNSSHAEEIRWVEHPIWIKVIQ